MKNLNIPVGISDFAENSEELNYYYVDKTGIDQGRCYRVRCDSGDVDYAAYGRFGKTIGDEYA